jgi:hypothetical protein
MMKMEKATTTKTVFEENSEKLRQMNAKVVVPNLSYIKKDSLSVLNAVKKFSIHLP